MSMPRRLSGAESSSAVEVAREGPTARSTPGEYWLARLSSLQEIAYAVNSDQNLGSVLQTIVDTVVTYTPWRQCCIARLDEDGQEVAFVAERGFSRPELGGVNRWPASDSITPVAVRLGKPLA